MKDKDILTRLRAIRRFREERAEVSLGRQRNLTRQAEAVAQEKAMGRAAHLAEAAAAERQRLAAMTGTMLEPASLQHLEAHRARTAREAVQLEEDERVARTALDQSVRKLDQAQHHYTRLHASGKKLDEVIDRSKKMRASGASPSGSADDSEEWPI